MSTNIQIIEDALRDINVISEVDSASAEQGSYGLRKLNQLMEAWKEDSIDLGWFAQGSTTDTAPIPDWAELAITSALGIVLAPKYGASVSAEHQIIAGGQIRMVRRKLMKEGLDNADMSHMPSGHFGHRYDINSDT